MSEGMVTYQFANSVSLRCELSVTHHAQVRLDATFQDHARLGVALGHDVEDAGLLREELDHRRRSLRRGEQVNVPNHLPVPPQAACRAAADHVGMGTQRLQLMHLVIFMF